MASGNAAREQLLRSLTTAVYDNLMNRSDPDIVEEYEHKIHSALQNYDDDMLRDASMIVGAGDTYDERSHNTAVMLENGEYEYMIREYWHFAPHLTPEKNCDFPVQYLFGSLEHYPHLREHVKETNYTSPEATRKCLAIMNVLITLGNQPDHGGNAVKRITYRHPVLRDGRVADLLIERPELTEQVIDFINNGHALEYGHLLIALGLEDGAVALSGGTL